MWVSLRRVWDAMAASVPKLREDVCLGSTSAPCCAARERTGQSGKSGGQGTQLGVVATLRSRDGEADAQYRLTVAAESLKWRALDARFEAYSGVSSVRGCGLRRG